MWINSTWEAVEPNDYVNHDRAIYRVAQIGPPFASGSTERRLAVLLGTCTCTCCGFAKVLKSFDVKEQVAMLNIRIMDDLKEHADRNR